MHPNTEVALEATTSGGGPVAGPHIGAPSFISLLCP